MKIAIINLTGGGMGGGYRKYLKSIIPLMASHHEVTSLLCASPKQLRVHEWFPEIKNVKFVNCSPFRPFSRQDKELKLYLDEFSPDVLFLPVDRYFIYKKVPVVTMLQTMLPFIPV